MKHAKDSLKKLEKIITIRIMHEDAETVFSLIQTERNPIFSIEIILYYALFIQSCQENLNEIFLEELYATKIKNIRNYIKTYAQ